LDGEQLSTLRCIPFVLICWKHLQWSYVQIPYVTSLIFDCFK
jgi:hypothetical protein